MVLINEEFSSNIFWMLVGLKPGLKYEKGYLMQYLSVKYQILKHQGEALSSDMYKKCGAQKNFP